AQALAASPAFASAAPQSDSAPSALRVTPTRYNLGLARGYGSFAQSPSQIASAPAGRARMTESFSLSSALSRAAIPDISTYVPRKSASEEESRFGARVAMGEDRNVAATRDARSSVRDQMLDVAGSYRITNNLDVTAGVRYEQDRDIVPLPDIEQQDSQAVYVGTQFRF
ncbi:MAG: hypothetical protein WBA68_11920, partial [Alteraurantiacibacter sp.]